MTWTHSIAATFTALAMLTTSGCAIYRDQESVGSYVDDAAITTAVKARFIDNPDVDAASIHVETLKGVVMLSGFAKNQRERESAAALTWKVEGVKSVRNEIVVRP